MPFSVADVANRYDTTTHQKFYLEVKVDQTFTCRCLSLRYSESALTHDHQFKRSTGRRSSRAVRGESSRRSVYIPTYCCISESIFMKIVAEKSVFSDFFSSSEIYEASGFQRPVSTLVEAITVLSALPFTLTQAPHEGDLSSAVS